jgi:hypothetical protein
MNKILITILAFIFISCNENKTKELVKSNKVEKNSALSELENEVVSISEKVKPEVSSEIDSTLLLKFEKVHLEVNVLDLFSERDLFKKVYNDTIKLEWGLNEKLGGKKINLKSIDSTITKIEVFQNYKTSLSVSDDGAHIDLTDWIHHQSKWTKLNLKNNSFNILSYSEKESKKFPEISNHEILERVIMTTGNNDNKFTKRAKDCEGPNGYPCYVNINEITLKIVIHTKNNGILNKTVLIETPSGC